MSKKIFILLIYLCISNFIYSQNKYSINFQVSPTITFFKSSIDKSIFIYKAFGSQKNTIGICYSIELEKELGKKWSLSIGNSRLSYLVDNIISERLPTSYYNFEGGLRHTLSYITATFNHKITSTPKSKLTLGLGIHILNEKNQYFEIDAGKRVYTFYEYKATEGGTHFQVNYEKKLKENVYLGFNARLYYLISVEDFGDLSFGPYLKVNL